MNATASDEVFLVLLALKAGQTLDVVDGRPAVVMTECGPQPVSAEALDELESRGWLSLDEETPKVTERGGYWLRRWADKVIKGRA